MLDGLGSLADYVAEAKRLEMPALAITDHGQMCAAPQFYHAARKADLEPIIGEEFYFVPNSVNRPTKEDGKERAHVGILAKGEIGYQVLAQLSTESHKRFWKKPLLDKALLESLGDDAQHLVVLSGCAASAISQAAQSGDQDRIRTEVLWWRETFPNFYIEMMDHSTDFDKKLNAELFKIAKKYHIPWVITNDPHYVFKHDAVYHDTLLAIQTAADIDDPKRFKFQGEGYHLRSRAEMKRAFSSYDPIIWKRGARNTLRIAEQCHTRIAAWEKRTWRIPNFPDTDDAYAELKRLTKEGLKTVGRYEDKEYRDQAKTELKVIKEVGISDFLLITRDSIEWARANGIPVGPGRGSVCGTLVGYLIGIHKIDPIKYELLFERFLNPARPRMPDIDTDFGQERRGELFEYVAEKYGAQNVVNVAAYQNMKLKSAFQSCAKAYGVEWTERIRISKMFALDDTAEDVIPEDLQEAHPDLAEHITRLAGTKKGVSTHPAGVIIADPKDDIRKLVPEMWIPNTKRWVGQYDLDAAEEMGLMKQDFLGLRTLDTVQHCLELIKENTGEDIDPDTWIPDEEEGDDEVYKMVADGRTAGVFQMEGATNQRGCREVLPICFEDIVSITSLYRTGAISAGFPKIFNANRKKTIAEIPYIHPLLEPILNKTWGVVLYQEQVMDFGRYLAGFTMEQVDDIKEAIKHKKSTLMEEMGPLFVEGCMKTNGIPRGIAKKIWKMVEGYSGYGYNRSHAVAYTFLTYQTARLKKLYPLEYLTALLRTVDSSKQNKEKRDVYLREAIEAGLKILPPDINKSGLLATPDREAGGIRFGLTDLARVGDTQGRKLIDSRPDGGYSSLEEVAEAARNKGVLDSLTAGGCLSCFDIPGDPLQQEALLGWTFVDNMKMYRKKYKKLTKLPQTDGEFVRIVGEIFRKDKGKTKHGSGYVTWKIRHSITESYDIRLWSETSELWDLEVGSVVMVHGNWEERWLNLSISDPDQVRVIKRNESK